jgi:hypothetical protein
MFSKAPETLVAALTGFLFLVMTTFSKILSPRKHHVMLILQQYFYLFPIARRLYFYPHLCEVALRPSLLLFNKIITEKASVPLLWQKAKCRLPPVLFPVPSDDNNKQSERSKIQNSTK